MIKAIVKESLKYLANLYRILKLHFWGIVKNERKWKRFNILIGDSIMLFKTGDIAKILYGDQHLVRFKKSFEYQSLDLFKGCIKEGDIVFDIGANIGLFSLLGAKYVGDSGRVYAFEPTKQTFAVLNDNIHLNQFTNILPFQTALADCVMPVQMTAPQQKAGMYTDAFHKIKEVQEDAHDTSILYTEIFDDVFSTLDVTQLNVIKVDIEGAELLFFKGAVNTLLKYRPKILFEAREEHCKDFNYSVIDLLVFIHELGYTLSQLNEEQWYAEWQVEKLK